LVELTELRERFLSEIGHTACAPGPDDLAAKERRVFHEESRCGWWWCGASLARSQWENLQAALDILRSHTPPIDPMGFDILSVAAAAGNAELLRAHRDQLDRFVEDAKQLRTALWPNGPVGIVKRFEAAPATSVRGSGFALVETRDDPYTVLTLVINRIEPLRQAAHRARPPGQHAGTKNGPREALTRGHHEMGWTIEAVAAALILTGVDRDHEIGKLTANLQRMNSR
jgi:hypothetical protein